MFKKNIQSRTKSLLFLVSFFGLLVIASALIAQDNHKSDNVEQNTKYTAEQEYLFDVFKTRRSVRQFKSTPIPEEHIQKMLEIACSAPTSGNQQPWKFLVVRDREKINRLQETYMARSIESAKKRGITDPEKLDVFRKRVENRNKGYLSAPLHVVVLVDSNSTYPSYNIYDGTLAAGYIIIAARALGYGSVFCTDSFPPDLVREVFEIPENFGQICYIPIGIPEEWPEPHGKKPAKEFTVFEKFIEGVNYTLPIKRVAIEVSNKILVKYVGKYKYNENTDINIILDKKQLYAQLTGQPKIEIYPESETEFFLKVVDAQISFVEEKGKVAKLIWHQGGDSESVPKIE